MLLGAVILLTLILLKGDICPGQRGRIHKMLPVIAAGWLIASIGNLYWLPIGALVVFYFSRVKTGKTRGSGPLALLVSVNVLAGLIFAIQLVGSGSWLVALISLLLMVLLGASFAHLLLVVARTRLQAFHKLLPVVGIVAAMSLSLCLIPLGYGLSEAELELRTANILGSFMVMIGSIVVWVWPVVFAKAPSKVQLGIVSVMLLISTSGFLTLIPL
jgi:hypothetical protein